MKRTIRVTIGLAALGLLSLASAAPARADVIQLAGFSVSGQCPTPQPCLSGSVATQGFANVGTPAPQNFDVLPSPYIVVVGPGQAAGGGPLNTLTYSLLSGGSFQFRFVSEFSPFVTSALYNQGLGAVAIDFAQATREFGFQVQNFDLGSTTFFLQAFNGQTPLGTFSVTGSTAFLGLRADDTIITRILISSTGNNFAIGATHVSVASNVPEPATITLLGMGIAGAAVIRCKQRKASESMEDS